MEFPFEKMAMENKPLPKGLDIADSCTYIALKYLYMMYRKELINRKDATEEKKSIIYNWSMNKSEIEFLDRECFRASNRIRAASEEYVKNPTINNADKLYAAFYNLSEDWRKGGLK